MDHQSPITTHPIGTYKGIAAEDIEPKSVVLLVICPELMPNTTYGNIGASITNHNISLKTKNGKPVVSQVTTANHIVATWEGKTNVRYPPLIRKGEPVEIYRAEGQDKYYWKTTGLGRDFRTSDRHTIEVSATDPSKGGVEKDDTNTYIAVLDPTAKKVYVRTSKANGEPVAISLEIDTAKGTVHISDDSPEPGNRLFLDTGAVSKLPSFQINLSTGAVFKLEDKSIYIQVEKFFVKALDRFVIDSPIINLNINKMGTIIFNAQQVVFNTSNFVLEAVTAGINATSTKVAGVLAAASARFTTAVKKPFGSSYQSSSLADPIDGKVSTPNNNPDTDVLGESFRTEV